MNLDSINGMGPIKLPAGGNFGSGDIPVQLNKVYSYSQYISSLNVKDDDEYSDIDDYDDEYPEEEEEYESYVDSNKEILFEKSVMDDIKSKDVKRTTQQQILDYQTEQRNKLRTWYVNRKAYYADKIRLTKSSEERKILKNSFKMEVIKKKKDYAKKIMLYKTKKNNSVKK